MTVVLRTAGLPEPESLVAPARASLRDLDAALPMYDVSTMAHRIAESLWPRRASSWFLSLFAGFALVLAAAGIYGVVSSAVSERQRELGIRMALGAERRDVMRAVVASGMSFVGLGLALGIAGSIALSRLLATFLFGVSAGDLRVYTFVAIIVFCLAFVANWIPARRAARTDLVEVLRAE